MEAVEMNKVIMMPFLVMALLTGIALLGVLGVPVASWAVTDELGENETTVPVAIGTGALIFIFMGAALTAALVAGIHFFGFGLSDYVIKLIYQSLIWWGMWAAMTVATAGFFTALGTLGIVLFTGLTLVFAAGFAMMVAGPSGG
jgi:hypothetical protein